jgi:dihydrofolate reductase
MAVKREQTMTCCGKRSRISARRSWVAICSAEALARGERILGRVGGATTLHTTTRFFVLTHFAREPLPMQGGTTFFFVTDGIKSALKQARRAANGKDVALGGGANVAQQYLASGLIDELEIHFVPILLGGGARLFDNVNYRNVKLEPIRTIVGAGVTHLKYCVLK